MLTTLTVNLTTMLSVFKRPLISQKSAEIDFLKKQIDVKDKQLGDKDKQIEQLSESLRASQMLQAGLVQQIQCLSLPDNQTEPKPEPEAKPR